MTAKATLLNSEKEYCDLILSGVQTAVDAMSAPDFVPVLPPPLIKHRATSYTHGALRCTGSALKRALNVQNCYLRREKNMTKAELETKNKHLSAECTELKKALDSFRSVKHAPSDTYQKAVERYGPESRFVMTMEEMAELTKELSKRMRGYNNLPAITEEMADVEIMLEQLKIIFGNRSDVDAERAKKLFRLADLLGGG